MNLKQLEKAINNCNLCKERLAEYDLVPKPIFGKSNSFILNQQLILNLYESKMYI